MRIQHIILGLSAILLLIGVIVYDISIVIIALVGITLSGWGFVYPERANIWLYRVQSNIAKEKIEKELREYRQELTRAEGYITRFAETFDLKFPLQWSLDSHGKIIPATINELSEEQLHEPFRHFQELLADESIMIPEYIVQLAINQKVDQIRYSEFADYIEASLEQKRYAKDVIQTYVKQIGRTTEEIQYMNKIFTIDYLLMYLMEHFSKEDLQLQLRLDLSVPEKARNNIQNALHEYTKDLERERRVNTMRGILYGKIQPSVHKTIADWEHQGQKSMEEDLKELFMQMGYEVKEPNTKTQGIDLLLKKMNQRIAVKCVLLTDGTLVSTKMIQEAFAGKSYWDCQSGIVVSNGAFSEEALETASKLNIETWNGEVIQKMADKYWNNDIEYWKLLQYKKLGQKEEKEAETEPTQILQSFSQSS